MGNAKGTAADPAASAILSGCTSYPPPLPSSRSDGRFRWAARRFNRPVPLPEMKRGSGASVGTLDASKQKHGRICPNATQPTNGIMKSYIRGFVALLAFAVAPGALTAQQGAPGGRPGGMQGPPTMISGRVQDAETGGGLASASVGLWSATDSALVTGALTDEEGRFAIPGVTPGAYYARVTYIGYEVKVIPGINLTPAAPRADLGVIALATSAVELEGITVESERSAVQLAVDRTIYNAREMPAAAGGTATDVLRNVPAVEVDLDGNVSLRGNSNVAIQINGRPAPMRGQALTNFLQQLPAGMVERVEVVPNPSAAHDPEGMGGIINIVLDQNTDLGMSAGFNAGYGTGGRWNASGNAGYQAGALTLTGSYGFMQQQRDQDGYMFRTNLISEFTDTVSFFDQQIAGEQSMGGHNGSLTGEWKFTEQNFLTAALNFNAFSFENNTDNLYEELACPDESAAVCDDSQRTVRSDWNVRNEAEFANTNIGTSVGFRRTIEPQRNEVIADLRFNFTRDETPNMLFQLPGENSSLSNRLEDIDQVSDQNEYIAQLDVIRPLTETIKLETGYKGTLRGLDNEYVSEIFNGSPLPGAPDTVTQNDFVYDEMVNALYAVVTKDFGRFDLQGGVRAEQTNTEFDLLDGSETTGNDYFSLFPSASVLYELSEGGMQSLRASYARRINRPQARQVNPFRFVQDQFSEFRGNPELGPEYTDAFELTYNKVLSWGSLQLTPFYRRQTDIIRQFVDTSDPDGVRRATFVNAESQDQYGADATTSLRYGPFNGFVSLSGYQQNTDASNIQAGLGSDGFTWNARVSLSYKLTESTDLQYFHFYRGAQNLEQGRVSSFEFSNFAIRQKLWFPNATLTARVMDPFDRMGFNFHTEDERQIVDSARTFQMRALFLQFSYTWGQEPRIRQRAQDAGQQGQQPDSGVGIQ